MKLCVPTDLLELFLVFDSHWIKPQGKEGPVLKEKRAVSVHLEAPIIIPSQSMTGMIFQAASLPRVLEQFFLNGLDVFLILPVSSQLPQISL